MEKLYERIDWHNDTEPALNETNLNLMSKALDDIDDRVVELGSDVLEVVPQIQHYLEQAEDLVEAMETLSKNPPYIGENGNWYVWDTETNQYVDSGVDASITVSIADITMLNYGANPYVTNTGTDTDPIFHLFIPRAAGIQSVAKTSTSGLIDTYTITFEDGHTTTFSVTNGRSVSNIAKTSTSGLIDTYTISYSDGTSSTFNVTNGAKGDKGDKGDTGDTGAQGPQGATGPTGNGISNIAKTSTSGLVDTYTITFTDGTTTTFNVTNGQDGGGTLANLSDTSIANLQNDDILQYDSTAGKWMNKQGSSGGGHTIKDGNGTSYAQRNNLQLKDAIIEDDATNNTTVVKSNTFIGTRAEWNALSTAEKAKYKILMFSEPTIFGAEWDGTSTTSWTRTDGAENFSDPVPYIAGATNYGSPFDTIQPWAGMVKTERTGGTMVAIPKFWYKLTQDGAAIKIQIANKQTGGFSVSPAHMDRGDGKGERDVVYVGRYHCATSTYKSKAGEKPAANATRSAMRTSIHNLGSNIWQIDFATRFTLWLLYIVEFADWNSQAKIGYGCGNNSATVNMGYTDSMPYHTGTTLSSRTSYGASTQYRNIEGLWDNVRDWLDGCYYNSSGLNIILNPNNYSDSSGGIAVGVPISGYPSAFSVKDISGTYPLFIPSATGGSTSTYSCDYWNFDPSYPCLNAGGSYYQSQDYGLFYVSNNGSSYSYAYIGSRLLELP